MSAFLGTSRQWELFGRRIRALQRRDGFTVFHAKEFKRSTGEFRGWGREKGIRLVHDLAAAIRDELTEGVTITLPRDLYESEYRAPPVPKGVLLDSQYGLCFRMCMFRLASVVAARNGRNKLNVIAEAGHKNEGDLIRVFEDMKVEDAANGIYVLGTIKLARKEEYLPLMIADFQAHASSISDARIKRGQPGYFDMTNGALPKRREAGLTQIECTPESLQALKVAQGNEYKRRKSSKRMGGGTGRAK